MACNVVKEVLAPVTIATDTTTTTDSIVISYKGATSLIGEMTVSSRTDGSYTFQLQHSLDGSTWYDLGSATSARTTNGSDIQSVNFNTPVGAHIRGKVVSTSTTSGATISCKVAFSVGD